MVKQSKMVMAFEDGAEKKGYSLNKDDVGNYEDNWLQEAWEIFCLIDLDKLIEDIEK